MIMKHAAANDKRKVVQDIETEAVACHILREAVLFIEIFAEPGKDCQRSSVHVQVSEPVLQTYVVGEITAEKEYSIGGTADNSTNEKRNTKSYYRFKKTFDEEISDSKCGEIYAEAIHRQNRHIENLAAAPEGEIKYDEEWDIPAVRKLNLTREKQCYAGKDKKRLDKPERTDSADC